MRRLHKTVSNEVELPSVANVGQRALRISRCSLLCVIISKYAYSPSDLSPQHIDALHAATTGGLKLAGRRLPGSYVFIMQRIKLWMLLARMRHRQRHTTLLRSIRIIAKAFLAVV